jgi:hypothetical protein
MKCSHLKTNIEGNFHHGRFGAERLSGTSLEWVGIVQLVG